MGGDVTRAQAKTLCRSDFDKQSYAKTCWVGTACWRVGFPLSGPPYSCITTSYWGLAETENAGQRHLSPNYLMSRGTSGSTGMELHMPLPPPQGTGILQPTGNWSGSTGKDPVIFPGRIEFTFVVL